jgi:hypothetical protein
MGTGNGPLPGRWKEKQMGELEVISLPEIPLSEQVHSATVFAG